MQTTEFDAHAYATSIVRYGRTGARPPDPVEDEHWELALATLAEEKVLGIACAAADDGWLPLTDDQYAALAGRQRYAMAWCLDLERRLLQIADAFDAERIEFIVLKGPALAHTVYPDPSWRTFTDLDVLVRAARWRAACGLLEQAFHWPRRLPEPRPDFDIRFGKAAVFTTETGQQIDLHRTLAQGPFGIWINPDDLFSRGERFPLADRRLCRLNDTGLFLHACIHSVLGDPQPTGQQLRDVHATATRGALDEGLLQAWMGEWRLAAVVHRALANAASWQDDGLPPRLARLRRARTSKSDSRLIDAHTDAGGKRLPILTLQVIPRLRDQAAYVVARAFPSAAFLQARGVRSGNASRLWRLVKFVLALRGRALRRDPVSGTMRGWRTDPPGAP